MMEYFKRKFTRINNCDTYQKQIPYPRYYEDNGLLIKEMENGKKYVITLDENHKEVILGLLK